MKYLNLTRRSFLLNSAAIGLSTQCGWMMRSVTAQPLMGSLRIITTAPPGSIPDIISRRIAEQLTPHYSQGVIVDNRPGAAGQIAINTLKSAPADGSTVLLAQGAVATVYDALYSKLSYDPNVDLRPVSLASEMSMALAIGPAVPAEVTTLAGFVDWVRKNPKLANAGSPGVGTFPHLLEAMLFRQANVSWQHIAYAGGPSAIADLLGGQLAALVLPEGLFRTHKAAGRIRVLATSGAKRSDFMPDVPSFAELGHSDIVMREWFAFFMPSQSTAPTIDLVAQRIRNAVAQPALNTAFSEMGMSAVASTPIELRKRIESEQRLWQPIIRAHSIKADA